MKVELKSQEKYKNKKTGQVYYLLREVIDATNSREGKTVCIYINPVTLKWYARDTDEFLEKFEKLGE